MTVAGRRMAASVLLCALAVPFVGVAPSAASSPGMPSANVEAVCPAATPGTAECLALRRTDIGAPQGSLITPLATTGYLMPADIQGAYSLPTGSQGSGLTVAIVDAYDLPTAEADLAYYRSYFGLPACTTANGCFRKVNQNGGVSYPAANAGWGLEIALDLDMVSAACPHCDILLVEANDNQNANLGASVNTAVSLGAVAVSNSYSSPEWSGETNNDTLYYNHPGVAITASTGDCGYNCSGVYGGTTYNNVGYPAASPYVVAVGGTSLTPDGSARGWSESAWGNAYGGAGSGCSLYEPKPSWQHDTGCGAHRTQADVSAVADPATGVWIYEGGYWHPGMGGTSAASPIIAAAFALAGGPAAGTYPASYLYGDAADLNDVVGGNNDVTEHSCTVTYLCNGVAGYDGPTGLGTPNGVGAFTAPTVPGKPTNLLAVAGNTTVGLTWTAPNNGGRAISSYTVTETEHGLGVVACSMTGASSCNVSGLTNGTEYTFTIHATNVMGPGPESDPSNKVTPVPPTVPGKPTGVVATAGNASALVSWTAPASNGGNTITGYTVTSSPDGKTCTWTTGPLSCTVSTLTNGTPYTVTVTATNGAGTGLPSDPSAVVTPIAPLYGATYHAITPTRVLDTRNGTGGLWGPFTNHTARTFQVTGGSSGVPSNATAVTGNLTVTGQTSSGYFFIGPVATNNPTSSTLNFPLGDDRANTVTVALGAGGTISITFVAPSNGPSAHAIFDVTGYFTPDTSGATYHALSPNRVLDTRNGTGGLAGPFTNHAARTFGVTSGSSGVPSGATAVTGNLTVTGQTSSGYFFIGPNAMNNPTSSTLNFPLGDDRANGVTVALGAGGTLSITFVAPSNGPSAHAIFDVTGYFTADMTGATYVPLTPTRLLDTRNGTGGLAGPFTNHAARTFGVSGGLSGVPSGATAVTGNLTVTGQTGAGYLFIGPTAMNNPTSSTLNFPVADDRANAVTVALGAGGTLSITFVAPSNGPTAHAIFDVTGYFVPAT